MISFSTIYPKVYSDWDRQESFNTQMVDHTVILKDAINALAVFKRATFTGTQDGTNKIFTLDYELVENSEQIYIGSAFLCNQSSEDYTITAITMGGAMTKLEFINAPYSTDKITIFGVKKV